MLIYLLTFSSGKQYVGQTSRTLKVRLQSHRAHIRAGSMLALHCAWRVHGEPTVEVLSTHQTEEAMHVAEIAAIVQYGTLAPNGYNLGLGGETAPSKNPEIAAKISLKAVGRAVPDHVKEIHRENMRARMADPEYVAKVKAGAAASWTPERRALAAEKARLRFTGRPVSEETKAKLRGQKRSAEARAKMSASAVGKIVTEETRKRMSIASSSRTYGPQSEARRKAISDGIKAAWADPIKRAELMEKKRLSVEARRLKAAMAK